LLAEIIPIEQINDEPGKVGGIRDTGSEEAAIPKDTRDGVCYR